MAKIAVRLLMLSMFTTSLLVGPLTTEARAATTTKHMKKKRVRVTHENPKAANPDASPSSNNRHFDPFEGRPVGGY